MAQEQFSGISVDTDVHKIDESLIDQIVMSEISNSTMDHKLIALEAIRKEKARKAIEKVSPRKRPALMLDLVTATSVIMKIKILAEILLTMGNGLREEEAANMRDIMVLGYGMNPSGYLKKIGKGSSEESRLSNLAGFSRKFKSQFNDREKIEIQKLISAEEEQEVVKEEGDRVVWECENGSRVVIRGIGKSEKILIMTICLFLLIGSAMCSNSSTNASFPWNTAISRLALIDNLERPVSSYRTVPVDLYLYGVAWRGQILPKVKMLKMDVQGRKRVFNHVFAENATVNTVLFFTERGCGTGILSSDGNRCLDEGSDKVFYGGGDSACNDLFTKDDRGSGFLSDSNICSVDGVNIKDCVNQNKQMSTLYMIWDFNGMVSYSRSVNLYAKYDVYSVDSYNCLNMTTQATCLCKKGECKGTDAYCDHIGCGEKECYCREDMSKGRIFISNGLNPEHSPKCIFLKTSEVGFETIRPVLKDPKPCDDCNMEFDQKSGYLTLTTGKNFIDRINYCANPGCDDMLFRGVNVAKMELTKSQRVNGGKIEYWCQLHNEAQEAVVFSGNVTAEPTNYCKLINCVFCTDMMYNFSCWGYLEVGTMFALFLSISAVLIVVITMFKWIAKVILFFVLIIRFGFRKGLGICLTSKDKIVKHLNRIEKSVRKVDPKPKETDIEGSVGMRLLSRNFSGQSRMKLGLFVLLSLGLRSNACMTNFPLGETPVCTQVNETYISCSKNYQAISTFGPVGTDSCYAFKKDGAVIGYIKIVNKKVEATANLGYLYKVPVSPAVVCDAKHHCNGAGTPTCHEAMCASTTLQDVVDYFPGSAAFYGFGGCHQSCGCAGCGCFVCADSCTFWKKSIDHRNEFADVYFPINWNYQYTLDFSFITLGPKGEVQSNVSSLVIKADGQQGQVNVKGPGVDVNLAVTLFGATAAVVPVQNACYAQYGGKMSYVECAKYNSLQNGVVGEIQCSKNNTCLFRDDLISVEYGDQIAKCHATLLSTKEIMVQNQLPKQVGDVVVGMAQDQFSPSIIYKLGTSTSFGFSSTGSFTTFLDSTNCTTEFVSLKGCYNCLEGAKLSVKSYATSDFATATIKCKDSTVIFHPKKVPATYDMNMLFKRATVGEDCEVSCSANKQKITVRGDLVLIEQLALVNNTEVTNTGDGLEVDIVDIFSKWWFYVAAVSALILVILLAYCVAKHYQSRRQNRKKDPIYEE